MAVHSTAIIHPKAELAAGVEVGPFCVIDADVRVSAGCRLFQGVYLTGWTEIGENCTLHPGVIVGHEPQDTKYHGERSYCRVGAGTILREYVTIHRGTIPESETTVGEGCFLLAGSHVAHNCSLGKQVTLINNVLLAGHVEVGDRVTVGGGAAIHQFVRIGELAMIAGQAHVRMDIAPFALVDVHGKIAGLNRIGLRRAGIPHDEITELREAYRRLFGSGIPFREAVAQVCATAKTPSGKRLANFLQSVSKRGLAGGSKKNSTMDDESSAPEAPMGE